MSGFSNPLANNLGQLIRKALTSLGYTPGVSGWQISKDGTAEFNNANFRGNVVVGVPPNPRIEMTTTIPATLVAMSTDFTWVAAEVMWFNTTDYAFTAIGYYNQPTPNAFPVRAGGSYRTAAGINVEWLSIGTGPNSSILYGSEVYNATPMKWTYRNGTFITAPSMTNMMDALDTYTNFSAGTPEPWNSRAPTAAGWTGTIQYRKVASPPRSTQVRMALTAGASKADGLVVGNLPAAYRPISAQDVPSICGGGALSTLQSPHFVVATNGDVQIWGMGAAAWMTTNNTYPMDV